MLNARCSISDARAVKIVAPEQTVGLCSRVAQSFSFAWTSAIHRLRTGTSFVAQSFSFASALRIVQCVLLALFVGACAKAQAKAVPEGPPLSVPEPPERVLAPVEEPLPAAVAVPEVPPAPAPRPPARTPVRRPQSNAAVPEPDQGPAAPAAAAPAPPATPTPTLRAAPSAADAAAERGVRETLARASRDLNRVDYGRLTSDGRAQYEQSKRFTTQAEQALKDLNFPFAATLADKAATLAAELLR
jgi:hypothetical protein